MGTQAVSAAFGCLPTAPVESQVSHEMPSAETLPAPHGTQVVESVAPVANARMERSSALICAREMVYTDALHPA